MAFRIEPDGKSWYDVNGVEKASTPEQQESFTQNLNDAISAREQAGGPGGIDTINEKVVVVEEGDTLWDIAQENNVAYEDILAANKNNINDNGNLIDVNDVVILRNMSPESVAQSDKNSSGIPSGEAAFRDEIYTRGNELQYSEDLSSEDREKARADIANDVGEYLDSLPPEERQAAVDRLIVNENDWQDSSAGLTGIQAAAEERGLNTTPVETYTSELYSAGNEIEYSEDPAINYEAEGEKLQQSIKDKLETLPEEDRATFLRAVYNNNEWTDAGPSKVALEKVAEELGIAL